MARVPYPGVYAPTSLAPGVVPRVMFWPGKVAQHINPATGAWETDPDGVDGGAMDGDYASALRYCQKWYAGAVDIRPYADETITTWRERGNVNAHTKTRTSFECLFGAPSAQAAPVAPVAPVTQVAPVAPIALVPRVMFWPGKVAQHINLATGTWETDPDGHSGGARDPLGPEGLAYCRKWYEGVVAIRPYADEAISTWREVGNVGEHTATRRSYECVGSTTGSVSAVPPDLRLPGCQGRFLATVTRFEGECAKVDLPKLNAFPNLEELTLNLAKETTLDVSTLRGLGKLRTLRIIGPALKDLSGLIDLSGLTQLTALELTVTEVPDLTPLAKLSRLERLAIRQVGAYHPTPARIDALASLTQLKELDLARTTVEDISPLATMTSLTTLNLALTRVADATPLRHLTALRRLSLESTKIVDLAPLGRLRELAVLKLNKTRVDTLAPIAGLVNMRVLVLYDTDIADLRPVEGMTRLRELHISNDRAKQVDLRPLARLAELQTLILGFDSAKSLTPLARLKALKRLVLPADCTLADAETVKRMLPGVSIRDGWGYAGADLSEQP